MPWKAWILFLYLVGAGNVSVSSLGCGVCLLRLILRLIGASTATFCSHNQFRCSWDLNTFDYICTTRTKYVLAKPLLKALVAGSRFNSVLDCLPLDRMFFLVRIGSSRVYVELHLLADTTR